MSKKISAIVSGAGLLAAVWTDLVKAVREKGGSDEDLHRLSTPDGKATIEQIALVIMANAKTDKPKFPSEALAHDLISAGWEIVEDVEPSQLKGKTLEMVSFLKGEDYVNGDAMKKRAVELKANLGLADAKYLLNHQNEIPVEFRDNVLVCAGTVLRSPGGRLCVACLGWGVDRWYLGFGWLDSDWRGGGRLLRCK